MSEGEPASAEKRQKVEEEEKVVFKGFLSTCVEVASGKDGSKLLEKRMVPKNMIDRPLFRWMSACASFRTEVEFYRQFAASLSQRGLRLPTVHATKIEGLDDLIPYFDGKMPPEDEQDTILQKVLQAQTSVSLELLPPEEFQVRYRLKEPELTRILRSAARLHGASFEDTEMLEKAEKFLFAQGGHWSPFQMRGWFSSRLKDLPEAWKVLCTECVSKKLAAELFSDENITSIGARLVKVLDFLEEELRLKAKKSRRSLIHGDFWSGNFLFSKSTAEVVIVDFQFTGIGRGAMDVAYLLYASADLSVLKDDDLIARLLKVYLSELEKASDGNSRDYSLEELRWEVKLCTLEICMKWFAGVLKNCAVDTLEEKPMWDGREGTFAFLESPQHLQWFIRYVHELLQEVETLQLSTGTDFS